MLKEISFEAEVLLRRQTATSLEDKGFTNYSWVQTGCVIAAHSGPGAFGIVGFAK